ncbi:hypothetical protein COD92_31405, partial [Bacillus sp. AFS037270]
YSRKAPYSGITQVVETCSHLIKSFTELLGDKAEIEEIIIVGKREDNEVYQEAYKRLQELKRDS